MERLGQDLRFSLRAIQKNPGFAAIVVLTLGLGIGANTVVYSTVDGIVLNPFPFPEPDRLVGVGTAFPKLNQELGFVEILSPAEYLDIRDGSRTLENVVAWDMGNRQLTVGETTENLFSGFWWGDAFPTLGVRPALGRGFLLEEIERGDPVAIISHRVWETRFGGDSSLVGGAVMMNGEPYTLVGIMPSKGLIFGMDLWIPMPVGPEVFPRGRRQFQVLARAAPGTSLEEVQAELDGIAGRVESEFLGEFPEYEGWRLVARTWNDINVSQLRPAALILLGAVGFVLLLVCVNVAGLLLSRSLARQREMAVRSALGAGRLRIVRQLLTESIVLALVGGAFGVGLGYLGIRGVAYVLASLPLSGDVTLNLRVLAVTGAVSLAAGLLFGLVPALNAARSDLQTALRNETLAAAGGFRRLRLQRVFVGIEVALAAVLLVGGGLLINSFVRLQSINPGFAVENVLTMRLTLARERYAAEEVEPFFTEVRRRLSSIPGVAQVASVSQYPPIVFSSRQIWFEGTEMVGEETLPTSYLSIASPEYFGTMRIPMKRGRDFSDADTRDTPFVAVLNETAARRLVPGGDPIGSRFRIGGPDSEIPPFEVVGIVGDTHNRGLEIPPQSEIYVSSLQADGVWNQLFLMVRTTVEPRSVLPAVRREIQSLDPEQPVYAIRTLAETFAGSQFTRRVSTRMLILFGGFALILAAVGIYGVVSLAASQRTREIGVRMALGAQEGQVRSLMVRQVLIPVGLGALAGLAGSIALGRLLSGLLFQVSPGDPLTLATVATVLVGIALAASYVPARRASRLDPVSALRSD
jgi:putative ABC transport system permease protein